MINGCCKKNSPGCGKLQHQFSSTETEQKKSCKETLCIERIFRRDLSVMLAFPFSIRQYCISGKSYFTVNSLIVGKPFFSLISASWTPISVNVLLKTFWYFIFNIDITVDIMKKIYACSQLKRSWY